ncbi:MAG: alanine racemase, partial [Candidatus Marinimicrobia bacterium]|nr:alanine racemase [Candidatus Neomarinimicrobiota bacterium]
MLAIKHRIGGRKLLCVIKANGYGHGAVQIAKSIENIENVQFAVFSFEEALELRDANIQNDILVFSRIQSQYIKLAHENNITLNISAIEDIDEINSYFSLNGACPRYHLKFDTGMTRLGFDLKDASLIYSKINKNIVTYLEGVYTHFATADEGNLSYAISQLNNFKKVIEMADEYGIKFKNIHCSNSGAIINIKDSYFNMVRARMLLYGALPSNEVKDNI